MHVRWSDNDRYFGPFTYTRGDYRALAVAFSSGNAEDSDWHERGQSTCSLRLSAFGHTLIAALSQIIQPHRKWVDTSRYEWSSGPNGGYWDVSAREFGFSYGEGFLNVHYGRVTNDSSTEQRWGYFLPWTQWRHVRRSFYDLEGEHFYTLHDRKRRYWGKRGHNAWVAERAIEDACPAAAFEFSDFDGERIIATTKIEEREWRFGTRWCKWLSIFRRPKIKRSLDLAFSAEVGKRKGSWKGGTMGHGINMLPGEMHETTFRRYCAEHALTFVGPAPSDTDGSPKGPDRNGLDGEAARQPGPLKEASPKPYPVTTRM